MLTYRNEHLNIIRPLIQDRTILDIGCIQHDWTRYKNPDWIHNILKQYALSLYGIDKLKEDVYKLQELGYNISYADAEDFDLLHKFDIIYAGEIIEHLANPGNFLQCAKKHLLPHGKLIITTCSCSGLIYMLQWLRNTITVNDEHACWYDKTTLCQLLERYGFEIEQVHYYHRFEFGQSWNKRLLAWLFTRIVPARLRDSIMVIAK